MLNFRKKFSPSVRGSSRKVLILIKTFLSVWVLYHLFVVIVMSNANSYVGRSFQKYITPYANITGFNTSWNFFAPNPANTMYFRYMVYFENENGEPTKEPVEGFIPQDKNIGTFDVRRRRELYLMHFLIGRPERLETLFAPHVCKENPGATSVRIEFFIETIAPLDEATTFKQEAMSDLSKQLEFVKQEYRCRAE